MNKLTCASVHVLNCFKKNLIKGSDAQTPEIKSYNNIHVVQVEMEDMQAIQHCHILFQKSLFLRVRQDNQTTTNATSFLLWNLC